MKRKLLVAACAVLVLAAAVPSTAGTSGHKVGGKVGDTDNKKTNESMGNVDPALTQLINASDKEEFAERNGISYSDGKALVVVELEDRASMPESHNTTEETNYTGQGKNLAQAYVPVEEIRSLSNEPGVKYVRLPLSPAPADDGEKNTTREGEDTERDAVGNGSGETGGTQVTDENGTQGTGGDEEGDRGGEGLGSVMGSIIATLVVVLAAAYGRRRL